MKAIGHSFWGEISVRGRGWYTGFLSRVNALLFLFPQCLDPRCADSHLRQLFEDTIGLPSWREVEPANRS